MNKNNSKSTVLLGDGAADSLSSYAIKKLKANKISISMHVQTKQYHLAAPMQLFVFGDRMPKPDGAITLLESDIKPTVLETMSHVLDMYDHHQATVCSDPIYGNTKNAASNKSFFSVDPMVVPMDGIMLAGLMFASVGQMNEYFPREPTFVAKCIASRVKTNREIKNIQNVANKKVLEVTFMRDGAFLCDFVFVPKDKFFIDELVDSVCHYYSDGYTGAYIRGSMSEYEKP